MVLSAQDVRAGLSLLLSLLIASWSLAASACLDGVDVIYATDSAFAAKKTDASVVTWGDARRGGDSSGVASQLTAGVDVIYANYQEDRRKRGDMGRCQWWW